MKGYCHLLVALISGMALVPKYIISFKKPWLLSHCENHDVFFPDTEKIPLRKLAKVSKKHQKEEEEETDDKHIFARISISIQTAR